MRLIVGILRQFSTLKSTVRIHNSFLLFQIQPQHRKPSSPPVDPLVSSNTSVLTLAKSTVTSSHTAANSIELAVPISSKTLNSAQPQPHAKVTLATLGTSAATASSVPIRAVPISITPKSTFHPNTRTSIAPSIPIRLVPISIAPNSAIDPDRTTIPVNAVPISTTPNSAIDPNRTTIPVNAVPISITPNSAMDPNRTTVPMNAVPISITPNSAIDPKWTTIPMNAVPISITPNSAIDPNLTTIPVNAVPISTTPNSGIDPKRTTVPLNAVPRSITPNSAIGPNRTTIPVNVVPISITPNSATETNQTELTLDSDEMVKNFLSDSSAGAGVETTRYSPTNVAGSLVLPTPDAKPQKTLVKNTTPGNTVHFDTIVSSVCSGGLSTFGLPTPDAKPPSPLIDNMTNYATVVSIGGLSTLNVPNKPLHGYGGFTENGESDSDIKATTTTASHADTPVDGFGGFNKNGESDLDIKKISKTGSHIDISIDVCGGFAENGTNEPDIKVISTTGSHTDAPVDGFQGFAENGAKNSNIKVISTTGSHPEELVDGLGGFTVNGAINSDIEVITTAESQTFSTILRVENIQSSDTKVVTTTEPKTCSTTPGIVNSQSSGTNDITTTESQPYSTIPRTASSHVYVDNDLNVGSGSAPVPMQNVTISAATATKFHTYAKIPKIKRSNNAVKAGARSVQMSNQHEQADRETSNASNVRFLGTGNNETGDRLKGYTDSWFSKVRFPAVEIECLSPTDELVYITQLCWRSGPNLIPLQYHGTLISSTDKAQHSLSAKKCSRGKRKFGAQQTASSPFSDVTFQNSSNVTNSTGQTPPGVSCPVTVIAPKPCYESQSNADLLSSGDVALQDASSGNVVHTGDLFRNPTDTSTPGERRTFSEEELNNSGIKVQEEGSITCKDGEVVRKEYALSDDDYEIVENVESDDDEKMEGRGENVEEGSILHSPSSTISPAAAAAGEMVEEEEWMSDDDLVQQYLEISNQPQDVFVSSSRSGRRTKLINYAAMDLKLDEGDNVPQTQRTRNVIVADDHDNKDSDFEVTDSDNGSDDCEGDSDSDDIGSDYDTEPDKKRAKKKSAIPRAKRLCPICGAMIAHLSNHIKAVHEKIKRFRCNHCEYKTQTKACLDSHTARKHDPSKLVVCEYCGKRYDTKVYSIHVAHVHCKTKNHACQVCGKKFPSAFYAKRHENKVHRDSNKQVCSVCGKTIKGSWNLKMHMAIHSGDRHYKCHLCDYKSIQLNALNWHMKSRHLISKKTQKSDDQ